MSVALAGYAIARGTLTMELKYKLENRKLAARRKSWRTSSSVARRRAAWMPSPSTRTECAVYLKKAHKKEKFKKPGNFLGMAKDIPAP